MSDYTGDGQDTNTLDAFNLFIETSHLVLKYADSKLEQSDNLSSAKFIVLVILETSGGTLTSAKLAGKTGTKPHNITKIIDRMKRDGLVTTRKNEGDRRYVYISLTDEGRSILEKGKNVANEIVSRTMASLSADDIVALKRLLNIFKKNITGNKIK
jgi:MarR family transcriptional regulator, 2-MHQ and catechol-resistance regulon repressor